MIKTFMHYICLPVLAVAVVWLGTEVVQRGDTIAALKQELKLARYTAEARQKLVEEARLLQRAVGQRKQVMDVTVTAYNPTTDQCDSDPLVAASMRKVREGTVAVSRDLFDRGWVFGKKIRIEGLGIFEINDLMNARFSKRIDVFMWDEDQARSFGKRVSRAALLNI